MTIERRIAGKARDLVTGEDSEYRSLCESLPILLRTAGLAQTVAFLKAKSKTHQKIYAHLESQLKEIGLLAGGASLIATSTDPALTTSQYRMLLEMTMLAAFWHKRMAQALIEKAANK